jgi:hypothetical protein
VLQALVVQLGNGVTRLGLGLNGLNPKARAVRLESAAAIRHWWGVSVGVVWRWRKALGLPCTAFQAEKGEKAGSAPAETLRKPGRPRRAVSEEGKPAPRRGRKKA